MRKRRINKHQNLATTSPIPLSPLTPLLKRLCFRLRFHWDSEIIAAALCPELSVLLGFLSIHESRTCHFVFKDYINLIEQCSIVCT
jgi:hypothetical protein